MAGRHRVISAGNALDAAAAERRDVFSLAGRTVLLTGASAGIGRRFAEVLGAAGATVIGVARSAALLDEMAHTIECFVACPLDLSDLDAIGPRIADLTDAVGPIDVLVNNAGAVSSDGRAATESLESIRATTAVNLIAPQLLAQSVVPGMVANGGGVIVNVTSIVARVGIGRFPQTSYAATKGGLEALTRAWAVQWASLGIRVNSLAPGVVATEMNRTVMDQSAEWVREHALIPRIGETDDFDGAILFLASDASRYVTGQTLAVDGGWTAR